MSCDDLIRGKRDEIQAFRVLPEHDALLSQPHVPDQRPEVREEKRETMCLLLQFRVYKSHSSRSPYALGNNTRAVSRSPNRLSFNHTSTPSDQSCCPLMSLEDQLSSSISQSQGCHRLYPGRGDSGGRVGLIGRVPDNPVSPDHSVSTISSLQHSRTSDISSLP